MNDSLPTRSAFDADAPPALPDADGRVVAVVATDSAAAWAASGAVALSKAWGGRGRRVVLFDGGIEHPSLHGLLGRDNDEGLTDAVVYGASVGRVARRVEGQPLFFVPAGTVVAEPDQVMEHPRWTGMCRGFLQAGATLVVFVPSAGPGIERALDDATDIVVLAGQGDDVASVVGAHAGKVRAVLGDDGLAAHGGFTADEPLTADDGAFVVAPPGGADADNADRIDGPAAEDGVVPDGVPGSDDDAFGLVADPPVGDGDPFHADAGPADVDDDPFALETTPADVDDDPFALDTTPGGAEAVDLGEPPSSADPSGADGALAGDGDAVLDLDASMRDTGDSLDRDHGSDSGHDDALLPVGDPDDAGADDPFHAMTFGDAAAETAPGREVDAPFDRADDVDDLEQDVVFGGATAVDTPAGDELEDDDFADPLAAAGGPASERSDEKGANGDDELVDPLAPTDGDDASERVPTAEEIIAEAEAGEAEQAAAADQTDGDRKQSSPVTLIVLLIVLLGIVTGAWWFGYLELPGLERPTVGGLPGGTALAASPAVPAAQPDAPTPASFSVAIESHRDATTAWRRMEELAARLPDRLWIVAPLEVDGTVYHRVLAGPAADEAAADSLAASLAEALGADVSEWVVRATGRAFFLGMEDDRTTALDRAAALRDDGIPAYVLSVAGPGGTVRYRVYAGAYADADEAAHLAAVLQERGLTATLSERSGDVP